jgi:SsrA-binding protein
MKSPTKRNTKRTTSTLAANRRALFDYEIEEKVEAGIALSGPEVKSAKGGQINLSGAYVVFNAGKPALIGARISPYPYSAVEEDPERTRQLLLSKAQIEDLRGKIEQSGYTLMPLRAYVTRGLIKIELGLGRGKRRYDKRETIKKRDVQREIAREARGRDQNRERGR